MKKILLSLFAVPLLMQAAEIYVSNAGNDKNSGTAAKPLKTINKAVNKAHPGDTIVLSPGIYREEISIRKSGKKDTPVTLKGTRGVKGEYLSIVEAPGKELNSWQPAPEIAPDVWKTPLKKRPDLMLMDGKMIALVNPLTMQLPRWKTLPSEMNEEMFWNKFGPDCKRLPGLDLLSVPADILVKHSYFRGRKERFWEVLNGVLTGWKDGMLYLRFANGEKPAQHKFTASYGNCFNLNSAKFWHFRDLLVRGSRCQFRLSGSSSGNRIENSILMQGGTRIRIEKSVSDTIIKNNVLTAGFTQSNFFKLRSNEDMRGGLLYIIFKYIIGTALSDDVGINDQGTGTKILGNILIQGLIGIDAGGVNCEVANNVVREMSSVGICTLERTVGTFHDNLVMNCGIPLRIHHLRHARSKREEYHYRNLFYQAPHGGGMTFIHCESNKFADKENFDPKTKKYKENPPNPVDAGKFYIYHNTFWGGEDEYRHFNTGPKSRRFRMSLPFYFMNNIIKYNTRENKSYWACYHLDYQDLLAGNLFFREVKRPAFVGEEEADIAKVNKVIEMELFPKLWNGKSSYGLPDVTLSKSSPAVGCGIDLSRPFTAKGHQVPVLPGMKNTSKKPDAGALQLGESQKKFFDMHRKAEETVKMLRGLK